MKVPPDKTLAKFEKLKDELRAGEAKAFGTKLPRGIERERSQLIEAISNDRTSGLYMGQLAARYRDRYKIEKIWMSVGESIAHALGYKSYTSLNSLMKAAERASKVPEKLLAALFDEEIDPVETKYRRLVKELDNIQFSGNDEEAKAIVQEALARFRDGKADAAEKRRMNKSAAAAQIGARIAEQVAISLRETLVINKTEQAKDILRCVVDVVRAAFPACIIQLTWAETVPSVQSADSRLKPFPSRRATAIAEITPIDNPVADAAGASELGTVGVAGVPSDPGPERSHRVPSRKSPKRDVSDAPGLFDEMLSQAERG